ncbi:MAG: sulfite exporter TauE/SafE family protein [Firmicutes bacterium]|nr:sulfite exporter TauE/SafE family protein [Bacillota bacterium]MBV1726919.1 sulfite exporter TauE/SafE family protein [Desulforudis sp.]MBU4533962.1 sulfite exporter TauE/SafE family protein [Bacillota bacterium]MBU4554311.1 sulfite exporter TauE/SafE family protein [Bacillota bacterium]MBV1735650.1 sulfite exporter TauE/SafE family protein [Desulforudis sp.]
MTKGKLPKTIAISLMLVFLMCLALGAVGVGANPELVGSDLGIGGKLGAAIAEVPVGTGQGEIDPTAPRGFLGVPGAPQVNLFAAFLWAIWVGWIFSTVGAFGGIMAGVGHMTVFGLGPYAKSFKDTAPTVNKLLTDSIRVSNQFLVGLSAFVSSLNYFRMGRLVWPLGLALGLGSIVGAVAIPWLTGGKISFSQYQGWFGLFVFLVGAVLLYETTPRGQAGKKAAKEAGAAFEASVKEKGEAVDRGVKVTKVSLTRISFTFCGVEFGFNPIWPILGGIVIAAISSFLGVGGGFLYVPFLTSIVGLPMFIVAGTSALTVFISMCASITAYIKLAGAGVYWSLIGVELIGIFIGSLIGPRTQKYIPEVWLKRLFVLLALYVGIGYFSKGFFGVAWVPI